VSEVGERDLIVAWLRSDAAEYEAGGPFGKVAFAAVAQAADAIERGEHLPLLGAAIRSKRAALKQEPGR
jgi:hypothetical protein